jgi:hypothetical protein
MKGAFLLLSTLGLLAASNAELIALDQVDSISSYHLVTIAANGTRRPVSQSNATIDFTPGGSAVDRQAGVLYLIGQKTFDETNVTLVGVSLKTGAVVSTAATPLPPNSAGLGLWNSGIDFAADLGLLVVSYTNASNAHILATVHPTTGEWNTVTVIYHPNTIGVVSPSSFVYIPVQQTFIWQLGVNHAITQFAFDFKTGTLRNATSAQITDFVFNANDGMVWGHGVTPGPNGTYWTRTVEKMDPATLKVERVRVLGTLAIDIGMVNRVAFDMEAQVMFWATTLFKDVKVNVKPVHLAQVSISGGNASLISTSTILCPAYVCPECGISTCPATLNFV